MTEKRLTTVLLQWSVQEGRHRWQNAVRGRLVTYEPNDPDDYSGEIAIERRVVNADPDDPTVSERWTPIAKLAVADMRDIQTLSRRT